MIVERLAQLAYEHTDVDPDPQRDENGVGIVIVLRRMVRFGDVRFVDVGPAPGRALVEPDPEPDGLVRSRQWRCLPAFVHVLRPEAQRPEQFTMACARASARVVTLALGEEWDEAAHESLALAVAMPAPVIVRELAAGSIEDVAWTYGVDADDVARRAAMLFPEPPPGVIDLSRARARLGSRRRFASRRAV
jgi:hypothetical protein